jgi:hypothetical protein
MDDHDETFNLSDYVLKQLLVLDCDVAIFVSVVEFGTGHDFIGSLSDVLHQFFPKLLHDHSDGMVFPVQVGS